MSDKKKGKAKVFFVTSCAIHGKSGERVEGKMVKVPQPTTKNKRRFGDVLFV